MAPIVKRVPVLIVGGGPCGMLLSLLLSRYQIPSLLVEKGGPEPFKHPRAHVLNTRSMEILRKVGLDEEIYARAPPREDWIRFRYCETLLEPDAEFADVDHSNSAEYRTLLANSGSRVTNISQPLVEECIRREALKQAQRFAGGQTEILFNHSFQSLDSTTKRVQVVRDGRLRFEVEPDIIVATDGAKSGVREQCGIQMTGKQFLESFVSVHFTCPELGRRLRAARKTAMLTFVFNSAVIAAVVVAHDARGKGNFVAHLPFFPPTENWQDFQNESKLRPLLARALTRHPESLELNIESVRSWGMHATLAETLIAKDGWVALAGDAAHQFPPSGGFGVNVGLSEVDNLAAKINRHYGHDSLMVAAKEYNQERLPIARQSLDVALNNYHRGLIPAQALGLERNAVTILSQVSRLAGSSVMRTMAGIPVGLATAQPNRVADLRKACEVDRTALPLFFPQVDLGIDVHRKQVSNDFGSHRVGRLLKHAWFLHDGRMVSSLDLANPFRMPGSINSTLFARQSHDDRDALEKLLKFTSADRIVLIAAGEKESRAVPFDIPAGRQIIYVVDQLETSFFSDSLDDFVIGIEVRGDGYVSKIHDIRSDES